MEELAPLAVPPYKLWDVDAVFDLPEPEWLMDYVIPKGGSTLLYGSTNVGKSLVALDWAFRMATGWKWMKHAVDEPCNVLYVYAEGGHDLQLRYQAWVEGNNHNQPQQMDNIKFLGLDEEVHLRWHPDAEESPEGVRRLYETAEVFKPDLIVFDPAQEVWRGMESNSDRDVQMAYRVVKEMKRRYNASTLIVHHARKDGDTFRGATTWLDLADVGFSVSETDVEGIIDLKNTKSRYEQKGHQWKLERRVKDLERVPKLFGRNSVYIGSGRRTEERSRENEIIGLLAVAPMRYSELARTIFDSPTAPQMTKLLTQLEQKGLVVKQQGRLGKYMLKNDADEVEKL